MNPEVLGALVGVGGTLFLGLTGYAIKGFIVSNGNGKSQHDDTRHCLDHYHMVETVAEVRTDVKWIREQMELGAAENGPQVS